jgi:Arc/MetJ-type ribon-helix-helix transcriptional regulator
MQMPSHTIKVSGISDDVLRLIDERVRRRHSVSRSEYIRELIRKDVLSEERTLAEILAPIHASTRDMPDTDDELDALFDQARDEVYQEKHPATR